MMVEKDRVAFMGYIMNAWEIDKHNFSRHPDGDYIYQHMQDAWEIWQFKNKEMKHDSRKEK
jgi:uncharacterized Zn finger protein